MRFVCALLIAGILCAPMFGAPLVTGNGFGFAVVSPETGVVTKFYAHPYSFTGPDPKDALSEGVATANFIKSLRWGDEAARAEYVDDSHVIRVRGGAGEGQVFMPFGMKRNVLIVGWSGSSARGWSVEWSSPVKSSQMMRPGEVRAQLLVFEGIGERLLLVPLKRRLKAFDPKRPLEGNDWALISLEDEAEAEGALREFKKWQRDLGADALAKREIAEVERWRMTPHVSFASEKERHLWRQSEILLRMAQSREPNRPGRCGNGMIVAALPDGSWFMTWVRDMAYAAVALARMGHREEARAALLAYFNARPVGKMKQETGGLDYQVSVVRYFGDGSEEPFFTMEGSTNIEYDGWGLVLWVMGEYLQKFGDDGVLREKTYRGTIYESARDYIVKPLVANFEKYGDGLIVAEDTSIWEERQKDKKHFAYTTAAAIVGLRAFADAAHREGDEHTRAEVNAKVALLEKGFKAAFIRDGELRGTLEEGVKNDIDGALLAIINWGLVEDAAVVQDTLERMELLKVASGGYRRVRSTYTDPAIYEYWYERQAFLFVDFNLAEIYRRLGRKQEADAILARIVEKAAADHNFVPEMYVSLPCKLFPGEIGDPTGAIPMVGYGAGVYAMHLLERETVSRTHPK